jgi:hypothetical protein
MRLRSEAWLKVSLVGFSSALSVNFFFAFAGVSQDLGLQYNLGYVVDPTNLTIFSKQFDAIIWLASAMIIVFTSLLISVQTTRRETTCYVLFILTDLAEIVLFLGGQRLMSFSVSLLFGTVFAIITLVFANRWGMRSQAASAWLTGACFLGLLTYIESLALLSRVLGTFPNFSILMFLTESADTQLQLSELLFKASPILLLMAILVWIPVSAMITWGHANDRNGNSPPTTQPSSTRSNLPLGALILGFASVLAVFVPLSPYITKPVPRGVDIRFYYSLLNSTATFQGAMSKLGSESHGPYLLLLYVTKVLTGWDAWQVVVVAPTMLALFFTASTYLLAHQITRSSLASAIAAVFAASWLHTTVGLFAAIYGNWLAMSFLTLCLYFLSKAVLERSVYSLILAIAMSYATAITHVWTWALLGAAMAVAFALAIIRTRFGSHLRWIDRDALVNGIVLLAVALPIIALGLVLPSVNAAIQQGTTNVVGSMRVARFGQILFLVTFTLTRYVGDILTYPLPLILTPLGILYLAKTNPKTARMLLPLLIVVSITTLLLDSYYQWRVLYILPFEIYSAAGVLATLAIIDWLAKKMVVAEGWGNLVFIVKCLVTTLVLLDSVNYALAVVSTLPLG